MLVLTVHLGDEIVIETPAGRILLVVGGPNKVRRRLGVEAPESFPVHRRGVVGWARVPAPAPTPAPQEAKP